jgi:hypothetical protein
MATQKLSVKKVDFRLPISFAEAAEVLVVVGEKLISNQPVAVQHHYAHETVAVRKPLGLGKKQKLKSVLQKQVADQVSEGDILAVKKGWLGKKSVTAAVAGVLEEVTSDSVIIKTEDERREITTPAAGKVVRAQPGRLEVQVAAWQLEGKQAWGEMRWGPLVVLGQTNEAVKLEWIDAGVKDKVVVFPGSLTRAVWHKLTVMKVNGIVCTHVPNNFEEWRWEQLDDLPAVLQLDQEGEALNDDLWRWFKDKSTHATFVVVDERQLVVGA